MQEARLVNGDGPLMLMQKIRECSEIIYNKTKVEIILTKNLSISYVSKGKNHPAGRAMFVSKDKMILEVNVYYLNNYLDNYLLDVVPHELAHLVAMYQYGKRGQGHGRYWRMAMRDIFHKFPYEHHIMGQEKLWTLEENT